MYARFFKDFLASDDTLRVYEGSQLVFASDKDRLLPLLEYICGFARHGQQVVILDKVTGNAAALLAVRAGGREVWSPLGSQLAVETLDNYSVTYYFNEVVPYIQKPDGSDICPMERLSMGKTPEEFYQVVKSAA
jgi:hypothetical protein